MSPKITSLATGLVVLGLCVAATSALVAGAPPAPPPAGSNAPSATVLLLTNGKVFTGTITENDDEYVVTTRIGEIRFKRRQVEQTFPSLRAAYEYKKERTPDFDPDERMKLAHWCLDQKMFDQAKRELEGILELTPDHGPAKAMLFQLRATAERSARRDQEVLRASAERALPPGDAPEELKLSEIRSSGTIDPKLLGPPVIFDLSPGQAAKRYQEFARAIHPTLQRRCAGCHHETAKLPFTLHQARGKRELANEFLVRTNLAAVLQIVDSTDPDHSLLLSTLLMPHKPNDQPLVSGPNHPMYRQISAWVHSLTPAASSSEASDEPPAAAAAGSGAEGFAADRVEKGPAPRNAPAPKPAPRKAAAQPVISPFGPTGLQLPPNPLGNGQNPPTAVRATRGPDGKVTTTKTPVPTGNAQDKIFVQGIGMVPVDKRATSPVDPPANDKDAAAKAKTKPKIDPRALEKVLTKPPSAQ